MKKTLFIITAAFILLFAIGVRFWDLGRVPNGLYWDEVAMLVDAKSVATSGHDMHGRPWFQVIFPSYGDYKLPVYIWLATVAVKIFGVSEWSLRLPSAVAGVLTVITIGAIAFKLSDLLIKQRTQKYIWSLAAMLTVAISPWSIMFSRTGFEGHVAQFLVAVSVLCLVLSRQRKWLVLMAAVLGGLATYTYFSVRFVWPVVLVAYWVLIEHQTWWHLPKKKNWRGLGREVGMFMALPLVIFGLLLMPMMRSPLYADSNRLRLSTDSVLKNEPEIIQSNIYRELAGNTALDRIVFHRTWLTARELAQNYADNVSLNFLFVTGDPNLRHGTGRDGLFLLAFSPFLLIGFYSLFLRHKRLLAWLVIWWLVALLPASVPEDTPHALRSLNALVPIGLLISWGMQVAYTWVAGRPWKPLYQILATGSVLVIIGLQLAGFLFYYFTIYPSASVNAWQQGYKEIVQTVYAMRGDKPTYIQGIDDKLYLWFMAYGPYTGQDFASWPSQYFQHKSLDRIFNSEFPGWNKVLKWDSMALVVTKPEDLEKLLQSDSMRPIDSRDIVDSAGNRIFQVVLIEKKL